MDQQSVHPKVEDETDFRNTLDDLYAKSKEAIGRGELPRFKNLLEIALAEPVILTAIHRIKSNHGSMTAGTDGATIREILEQQYPEVIQMVKDGLRNYKPQLLRRVWIPKPGKSEKRPLGIPTVNSYCMPPNKVLELRASNTVNAGRSNSNDQTS
jgi:hypothetical protein